MKFLCSGSFRSSFHQPVRPTYKFSALRAGFFYSQWRQRTNVILSPAPVVGTRNYSSYHLQVGAFMTSPSGCVVVEYPESPDPPFVAISAPAAIGHCDNLTLEGIVTFPPIGKEVGYG